MSTIDKRQRPLLDLYDINNILDWAKSQLSMIGFKNQILIRIKSSQNYLILKSFAIKIV